MLRAIRAIGRSIFAGRICSNRVNSRLCFALAIATFVFALTSVSAHAQQYFLNFESVLSTPNAAWCMDIPGAQYQAGTQLATATCSSAPKQTFGYDNTGNLTAGGYCVDAQPSSEGTPVILTDCSGGNSQVWVLQPFTSNPDVFAILNPDGFCVTVNGDIGEGTPLALSECHELASQGWVFPAQPSQGNPPVYGTYTEPVYYWIGGERYCPYDNGWNGAGWYTCDQYTVPGVGWGGPGPFPTIAPTVTPTVPPPTVPPTVPPPTVPPTVPPPTVRPTLPPTVRPTILPTVRPTILPTVRPTVRPTVVPTILPTIRPTLVPTIRPTVRPTTTPTTVPTIRPTLVPTIRPTVRPTTTPTIVPTIRPTLEPTIRPTTAPTTTPTTEPTLRPTLEPTIRPTVTPTTTPTTEPTIRPTLEPTIRPTLVPTIRPTTAPTTTPTTEPTIRPTLVPTIRPTTAPTTTPTTEPTIRPTLVPTIRPTLSPTGAQSKQIKLITPTIKTTTIRPTIRTGGGTIGGGRATTTFKSIGSGGRGGGGKHSDIRLKQDIVPLARLANGIELYRFRYKGSDPTTYVGVMAQEVQKIVPSAVSRDRDGYLLVNYDKLGLKFMTWDEWKLQHGE